ncbi:hypothetical protein MKC69_15615 [[Clostridium] innocuum]|nr:hypothetical protein [[Clostridium] innocuum]
MKKYSLIKKSLFTSEAASYSKWDVILTALVFIIAATAVCYAQKLTLMYTVTVVLTAVILVPFIVQAYFKLKHEKTKYEEYCLYFESVKMYFKVYKKLITALQETYKLFDSESHMAACIKQAIAEIEATGDYATALSYIDKDYHNTYLERLHNLLITGEKQGGDSVYYNLDQINYQDWKNDISMYQKKKKTYRYLLYLMSALSLGISLYSVVIYSDDTLAKAITGNAQYQLYTFVELEIMLLMFIYIYITLTNKPWIRSDE